MTLSKNSYNKFFFLHLMPQFIPLENDLKRVVNSAPVIVFQIDKNGIFTLSEGAALKKIN